MSENQNAQVWNQYAQNSISGTNISMAYLIMIVAHLIDHALFQLSYSQPRLLFQFLVAAVFILILLQDRDEKMHTFMGILLVGMLFFLLSNLALQMFPSGQFALGGWLIRILFIVVPFVIISILFKKTTNEKFKPNIGIMGLFFYVAFALPFISELVHTNQILQGVGGGVIGIGFQLPFEFLIVVLPAWMWYLNSLEVHGSKASKAIPSIVRFIEIVAILILVLSVIAANYVAVDSENTGGYGGDYLGVAKDFFLSGYDAAVSAILGRSEEFQQQAALALDFEGDVEQGAEANVGLTVERLQQSQQRLVQGSEAAFFTTLQLRSFGTNVPVTITCNAVNVRGRPIFEGIVSNPSFVANDFRNYDITCRFPFLPGGEQYTVNLETQFDYVVSAYLRRFFVREGLLDQFRGSNVPPETLFFQQYNIRDTNTVSIHTRGPISLHLNTPNVVEELRQTAGDRSRFRLQLGLRNEPRWEGRLYAINMVLISLPVGFEIARGGTSQTSNLLCTTGSFESNISQMTFDECQNMREPFSQLDCQNYVHYKIEPVDRFAAESISVEYERARTQEVVFACDIEALNTNEILGNAAFSMHSFRSRVAYTYENKQSVSLRVEEPDVRDRIIVPDIESL
ncbi:MAG: hypothetical protein ACMXYA_03065, partial [Candidatus Woesearchaeota archaeon]